MQKRKRERHGMARTPTYHAWAMMKQRCLNGKYHASDRYAGRNIGVCDRWKDSFVAFLEDMGKRPDGMSLDRIDNDGDYCPENCRWATPKQQANNTRRTRYVMVDGKRVRANAVAEKNGIPASTLSQRLSSGWTVEQAVGIEEHYPNSAITIDGETMTMAQWAAKLGISRQAVDQRIKTGWSVEAALTTPKTNFTMLRGIPVGPRPKKRRSALGQFITDRRAERGFTQRQLAEHIGLYPSIISMIETGKLANLAWHIVEKLAHGLDIEVGDIAQMLPERGIDMVQYRWYDERWKGGAYMSNEERERSTWLQVRMTEEEKSLLTSLSDEYGLSASAFVRMMIAHFDEKRPTVSVRFGPKADAPVAEMAGVA